MTSYLETKVLERRARLAALQRETEVVAAELRAYEDALQHQGANRPAPILGEAPKRETVTVASSGHWAEIIDNLVASGSRFTTDDVDAALKKRGNAIERKSIRSKLASFVNGGRLVRLREGVFIGPTSSVSSQAGAGSD